MSKTSSNFATHAASVELNKEVADQIAAFAAKQAETEAALAKANEAIAALSAKKETAKKAEAQDYTGFSKGAAALIKACGQRTRNDRARLTALVFDAKRISIPDICAKIKFVSDRHGNLTDQVFNRSDVMRVMRRVQADLLQSAQMYNLYIDAVVVDKVEHLQLFDRSMKAIEAPAEVSEPETPASEPESKAS